MRNKIKIAAWELECGWAEVEVEIYLEACREMTYNPGPWAHHPEGSGLDKSASMGQKKDQ